MRKIIMLVLLALITLTFVACDDDVSQNENNDKSDENQTEEKSNLSNNDATDGNGDKSESASEVEDVNDSDGTVEAENETNESNDGNEYDNPLSAYSAEEIEYARVWLQLGENHDIDELNVEGIAAGSPVNPDDETSENYPEDVIQLTGSRLVDGTVTYSSNGDGTVNEYNVPLRWDGKNPAGEEFYKEIIENTDEIYIDPGDDEKIIEMIKLLHINE